MLYIKKGKNLTVMSNIIFRNFFKAYTPCNIQA